ncbi:MAG: methyltransferase domain-containing protein [Spirochaetaceae bacterium]|nr:methyltransferase domain-containing protein [Spirochaetaceae bacterium]
MWELYDTLIDAIPPERIVDEAFLGNQWTMVRSGAAVGLAMTVHEGNRPAGLPLENAAAGCRGMALAELAAFAKSWNFLEASLGMAAINAYWNSPEHDIVREACDRGDVEAFVAWQDRVAGKKVAVIGHFFRLEQTLGEICDLSILEKRPRPGDYPDTACEFILPLQDFVFATGVTLVNKTLPRLLELSRKSGLIMAGPTVSLAPALFDWGVRDLQGFVVTDPALCAAIVRGEKPGIFIFDAGERVSVPHPGPGGAFRAGSAAPEAGTAGAAVPGAGGRDRAKAEEFDRIAGTIFAPIYPLIARRFLDLADLDLADQDRPRSDAGGAAALPHPPLSLQEKPLRGLDVGCGGGHLGLAVAEAGFEGEIVLIDKNPYALELAEQRIAGKSRFSTLLADVHALPLPAGYADLILSRGALWFWEKEGSLRELWRVLAPGGAAIIGGGYGSAALKEEIYRQMSALNGEDWSISREKTTAGSAPEDYQAVLEGLGVRDSRCVHDGSGDWLLFRKHRGPG